MTTELIKSSLHRLLNPILTPMNENHKLNSTRVSIFERPFMTFNTFPVLILTLLFFHLLTVLLLTVIQSLFDKI